MGSIHLEEVLSLYPLTQVVNLILIVLIYIYILMIYIYIYILMIYIYIYIYIYHKDFLKNVYNQRFGVSKIPLSKYKVNRNM